MTASISKLRSGIRVPVTDIVDIHEWAERLHHELATHFLLLFDATGELVVSVGESDPATLVALGSLAAGDVVLGEQLTAELETGLPHTLTVRQHGRLYTIITPIHPHWILLAHAPHTMPMTAVLTKIQTAVAETPEITAPPPPLHEIQAVTAEDLSELVDRELDAAWLE